jgi:hypothetical protein
MKWVKMQVETSLEPSKNVALEAGLFQVFSHWVQHTAPCER